MPNQAGRAARAAAVRLSLIRPSPAVHTQFTSASPVKITYRPGHDLTKSGGFAADPGYAEEVPQAGVAPGGSGTAKAFSRSDIRV
jgi:hypothetical protein